MRYLELRKYFKEHILFSVRNIRQIDPVFDRRRLSEWQEKGYIQKIVKGLYRFTDVPIDENGLFYIANQIHNPSYISLESALSYYGVIPESVFAVCSVSTKKTKTYSTCFGDAIYRHMHTRYFFGYDLKRFDNFCFKIASLEKAILDFFYLNADLNMIDDIVELRFNTDELVEKLDRQIFEKYLERFEKKSLEKRVRLLLGLMSRVKS